MCHLLGFCLSPPLPSPTSNQRLSLPLIVPSSSQQCCCLVWQGLPGRMLMYLSICNPSIPCSRLSRCLTCPASWRLRELQFPLGWVIVTVWPRKIRLRFSLAPNISLGKGFLVSLDKMCHTSLGRRLTSWSCKMATSSCSVLYFPLADSSQVAAS